MRLSLRAALLAALTTVAASCADSPEVSEAACQQGFTVCGGKCVALDEDARNCGACGVTCNASQTCAAGACVADCTGNLLTPVVDSWGTAWDGVDRPSRTFQHARDACAALGGRLPTISEMARVAGNTTGDVGELNWTAELWSLTPRDLANAYTVQLSNGNPTSRAMGGFYGSRCVCPTARPRAFTGAACFGLPGSECTAFQNGAALNIDTRDRPAIMKPAAVFECAASGGELLPPDRLIAAVHGGLPHIQNAVWMHTADDVATTDGVSRGELLDAIVQFAGTTPSSGWAWWDSERPFRCYGPAKTGIVQPAVAGTFRPARGVLAVDLDPETVGSYAPAVGRCTAKGGYLPTANELASLAMQGVPARGYAGARQTSDQVWSGSHGNVLTFKWEAEAIWQVDPAAATTTATRDAVPYYVGAGAIASRSNRDLTSLPYQCVYRAIDPAVVSGGACAGADGCFPVVSGLTRMWFDKDDRGPATYHQAVVACASLGAKLPSTRDYLVGIKAGLRSFGGTLITSDRTGSDGLRTISWSWPDNGGPNPDAVDQSTGITLANTPGGSYRCMWTNEVR